MSITKEQYKDLEKRANAGENIWSEDELSDCCGAYIYENSDICSNCYEHCSPYEGDE